MFKRLTIALAMAGVLLGTLASGLAAAERRVALVVGNSSYQDPSLALTNPKNDAGEIARVLRAIGFETFEVADVTKRGFEKALEQFAMAASQADSVLFYYAGHAMQFQGRNYLMPIDARLENEFSVRYQMISADDVRDALDRTNGVKIMILDACRNNPLAERLKSQMAGLRRNIGNVRGLTRIDATQGMVVAYATGADQVALDGSGRNSPFTAALVKRMEEPGIEIGMMFRKVAKDVFDQTQGRQRPATYMDLTTTYYLNQSDRLAWDRIKDSTDPEQFRDFIRIFPSSPLSLNAKTRMDMFDRFARERRETEALLTKLAEERRLLAEATARRQEGEEEARRKAEQQEAEAEAAKRREAEAQAAAERDRLEREAAERREAEEQAAKAAAERERRERETARLAAAERRRAEEEAAMRRQAEEQATKLTADHARKEAEAARIREQEQKALLEAAARMRAEQEAAKRREAEEQAAKLAAERARKETEAARIREQEQQALLEAAARMRAEQEAVRRREAEEQAARLAAERVRKEEEARLAEEEAARRRREQEQAQLAADAAQRLAASRQVEKLEEKPAEPAATAVASLENPPVTKPQVHGPVTDTPALVRSAQKELRRLGCFSGRESGSLDERTRDAVKKYLSERGRSAAAIAITDDFVSDLKANRRRVCPPARPVASRPPVKTAPKPRRQPNAGVAASARPSPARPSAPAASAPKGARPMIGIGF
jgi:hypothetical protein